MKDEEKTTLELIIKKMKSIFIIGPSGSGKSTLSQYLSQLYKSLFGPTSVLLVNLDPANPSLQQSQYDIDLNDLITIEDIMQEFEMGPNGAMLYAMEFLYENKSWIEESIVKKINQKQPHYKISKALQLGANQKTIVGQSLTSFNIIFDLPGQVELYLQNDSTKNLIRFIQKKFTQNTCILQLFDSTYIYEVSDFVSLCMMSLVTMINLQMPHINVLNKIDVIKGNRPALGVLNEYLDIYSIKAIVDELTFGQDDVASRRVVTEIASVIDQYGQVSFVPCSVYKIQLIKYLILQIQITFNTHEINKLNSVAYSSFIQPVSHSFVKEQLITQLQNDLFQQQQQQERSQLERVLSQLKKDGVGSEQEEGNNKK